MRLVAGVFALTLFAPFVRAQDTAPPPPAADPAPPAADTAPRPAAEPPRNHVPLRVVRVMPESGQALLFDRSRATHVLAEVGGKIDGYSVDEIDDDEVILSRDGAQFVLAAPAHPRERAAARPRPAARPSDIAAPIDPYGDGEIRSVSAPDADHPSGVSPSAPSNPAASSLEPGAGGVRVVHAPAGATAARPIEPGSDGVRVAQAPMEPEPAPSAARTPAPSDIRVAEAPVAAPVPAAVAAPVPAAVAAPVPAAVAAPVPAAVAAPAAGPAPEPAPAPSPPALADAPTSPDAAPPPPVRSSPTTNSPSARSLNAAMPDRPARAKRAAPAKPPRRSAASKQTDDALALADVMSGDTTSRTPRGPAAAEVPPADPPPPAAAAAARATSDSRTATPPPAGAILISRGEVDRALADFAKLTAAIHASFSATGVRVDGVGSGSIFERAGLKPGDTITAIDGTRLRSLDDAANLYARASTARAVTVQLVRDGQPLTLRVAIQ